MLNRISDISQRKVARVAGLLYLGLIVFGIFAQVVRKNLFVPGDTATTASNIMASESLFCLAFVSDLIIIVCFLLLLLALYVVLKPVNKNHASLMVIFVLVSVPIMFINMLFHFAALLLLNGADYLIVFEADQLYALVMFFLNLNEQGILIASIFWGLWLFPMGYLIYKSGYFPRFLGVLVIMAGFDYLIGSFTHFFYPTTKQYSQY